MSLLPGLGVIKGMALTLVRFFQPKATIKYPEVTPDISPRHRGRLELLYDEWGTLKCETCFQCAQACPIECIDMGGFDTRGRYHIHWGPAEQYAERREESALRRSGRTVPDPAFAHFEAVDLGPLTSLLEEHDYDPRRLLDILRAIQEAYGYLPVGALKEVSFRTGAPYALVYGTASYYGHLNFEPGPRPRGGDPSVRATEGAEIARTAPPGHPSRDNEAVYLAGLERTVGTAPSGGRAG